MSENKFTEFLKLVVNDANLKKEFDGLQGLPEEDAIDKIIELGASKGFVFSKDDYRAAVDGVRPELSEEDLFKAAGGKDKLSW